MNAEVKKNFLSDHEISLIRQAVYEQYESSPQEVANIYEILATGWEKKLKIEKDFGKASFIVRPMPKEILDKVIGCLSSYGYSATPDDIVCIFMRYSNEFGVPELEPHIDLHDSGLSVDYQLQSNVDWSVIVENEEYDVKNNDALVFDSTKVVHWRNPKIFKDGQFVDMVLFHFFTKNDIKLSQEEKNEKVKPYMEKYLELKEMR